MVRASSQPVQVRDSEIQNTRSCCLNLNRFCARLQDCQLLTQCRILQGDRAAGVQTGTRLRCSASLEQTVESWQRFIAIAFLKLDDPRANCCGPPIWVNGKFDLGVGFWAFAFLFLDESD